MIPYLIVFFFSTLAIYVSEKTKSKYIKRFLIVLGILLPSILAGCRAETIGSDVLTYSKSFYNKAVSVGNLSGYIKLIFSYGVTDIGYILVTFLCSQVFNNYHFGLFVYSFLTTGFFYIAFVNLKRQYDIPIWLEMLLYYLALYNISLNAIRQSIAVACVMLAFTYVLDKKVKKYILFCILAFMFHSSGIIGLVLWPMFLILREGRKVTLQKQIFQLLLFMIPFAIAIILGPTLVRQFVSLGIFRLNYLNYLSGGSYAQNTGISFVILAPQLVYFSISSMSLCMSNKKIKENLYLFICSALCFLLSFGTIISTYFIRCSYFFIPIEMLYMIMSTGCFNKNSKHFWLAIVVGIVFLFWIRDYVIYNFNETC